MKKLIVPIVTLLLISGCALTGMQTVNGGAFISNFSEARAATSNGESSKRGEACSMNVLGIYSGGDASVEAAKKNGNISKAATVDTKVFAVRPFYGSVCTIVTGS